MGRTKVRNSDAWLNPPSLQSCTLADPALPDFCAGKIFQSTSRRLLHSAQRKRTHVMINLRSLSDVFKAAMKLAAACAFATAIATGAAARDANTFLSGGNVGIRPASYECEGNACPVVTLTWEEDGQQFRVDNSSNQRVKVEVTTFAGTSSITVEPQKSDYLRVTYFNGPYHANYD